MRGRWCGYRRGLAAIGAGLGIGRIGAGATEGMARQPEIAGTIQTGALILGAHRRRRAVRRRRLSAHLDEVLILSPAR